MIDLGWIYRFGVDRFCIFMVVIAHISLILGLIVKLIWCNGNIGHKIIERALEKGNRNLEKNCDSFKLEVNFTSHSLLNNIIFLSVN